MEHHEIHDIDRARNGDHQAFRSIVEQYKIGVYSVAYDLAGNRHDAEDLTQEVFIKAFRSLKSFRGDAKLSSWLYRIAVNTHLNKTRKKALSSMNLQEDFSLQASNADAFSGKDFSGNPEKSAESTMIQIHIKKALNVLAPKERAVFTLRHYQDLPLKEIALTLEVAEGTVKSLLFRAVRRMQKELAFYRQDLGLEDAS